MMTLTPAYGRDYKSRKDVQADFDADLDFLDNSYGGSGKPINKSQVKELGQKTVNIRFKKLTQVSVIKVS